MKFISSYALKYTLLLTFLLSLITNIQSHRGEGRRGDHGPRKSQFDPNSARPGSKVFREEEIKEREFNKEEHLGPRKRHHKKGFKINSYQEEDQFLRNSDKCPEHSILIEGDCVALVDVGLINFLAMTIGCGLCVFIFISIVIGLVFLCRKFKRKFRYIKKIKKLLFRKNKIPNNSHLKLNETNNSEENINNNNHNNSFYNSNNQINSDANIINANLNNHNNQNLNRANMNVSNYSNLGNRVAMNSNNDFSMQPKAIIHNSTNNNQNTNLNQNNNNSPNDSFGRKINGILSYFPSLINKGFVKNYKENLADENTKQVEMNSKANLNKINPLAEQNINDLNCLKNQKNDCNQDLPKQLINPYIQSQNENVFQENPFLLSNQNYLSHERNEQSNNF